MKPNATENHHIWKIDQEIRLRNLQAQQKAMDEAEKLRLKQRHWMHCPKCGQPLAEAQNGSVTIDLCPSCCGVWLDANELEAIVEAESGFWRSCQKFFQDD